MRKITRQAIEAFLNNRNFKSGNTNGELWDGKWKEI